MQQVEQETHLSDYWRIIKERKDVVIIFFIVVVFTVTIGSFLIKPIYRATVKLLRRGKPPCPYYNWFYGPWLA